ncbi:hypothetical protein Poly30_26060 [Planctomycetes bacterium Poly30]|uniref:Uncharacterized protein n=1 Tax=Saltatorellus ferox TaxID=2528018 RepID=A0A518ESL3_9BACT|nr:hypothetical protein Poly30_26060 [Planctomycetes bacterium Poly30]
MEVSTQSEGKPPARDVWKASQSGKFATLPTGWTRFCRIFLPYQIWRFAMINLKMLRIIWKGHH